MARIKRLAVYAVAMFAVSFAAFQFTPGAWFAGLSFITGIMGGLAMLFMLLEISDIPR